jgi:hypothetical protein
MRASEAIGWLCPPPEGIGIPKWSDWWRKNVAGSALLAGSGLALVALLLYRVAAASIGSSQPFRPDDLRDGVTFFDSFSDPSIACAILRQETQRLLLIHTEHFDQEQASQAGQVGADRELAVRARTRQKADSLPASGDPSGLDRSSMQSLAALDAQVQDVNLDLGRTLLVVYAREQSWNEFVDRYLQIVRERPGRAEVVVWARRALDSSQKCGRAEEVADVLQHVVRFHPELRTAEGLERALAAWKAEGSPDLEVSKR